MNRLGIALIALVLLQFVVVIGVYYLFAKWGGEEVGFYGFSFEGISKTVSQIKSGALKYRAAMPTALLFATLIGNMVPFSICAPSVDVSIEQAFSKPKVSAGTTAIYGVVALAASIFASLVVNIIRFVLSKSGIQMTTPAFNVPWDSPVGALFMILAIVVVAPVTEEIICRGVLLTVFRRFGNVFAVVGSSLIWALLHGNLVQGVPVFLMGLIFGMLALKSESIIPTIILHSINNLIALFESSAASLNSAVVPIFVSFLNIAAMFLGAALIAIFYNRFEFRSRGANARGFAVFFMSVPMLIFILVCLVDTVMSIKPV